MAIVIKYIGPGRRRIGRYRWTADNQFETAVDVETAANLLTYPRPQFQVAAAQMISAADQAELHRLLGIDEQALASLLDPAILAETAETAVPDEAVETAVEEA